MQKPKISIVIGTYNRKRMLINCINSILNSGITQPYEIIVIDGGSNDGTLQWLCQQNDIITIVQHNRYLQNGQITMKRSWGYFMNLGFKISEADYICMLSDDCYIHPGAITSGYNLLRQDTEKKIGACAFPFRDSFSEDHFKVYKMLGDKILINHGIYRRDVLREVGWIDEQKYRFYKADSDLSLKIWARDYLIAISKESLVEHLHDDKEKLRSDNEMISQEYNDHENFKKTWVGRFESDGDSELIKKEEIVVTSVPKEVFSYLPKNISSLLLVVEMYLKQYIRRESVLFRYLKMVKAAVFKG